jgi:Cu/Ag efflux protein CusF
MKKALGLTLALMFGLSLSAAAADLQGTVTSIDRASQSFTLEDGTQLSVSDSMLSELTLGAKVQASYEMKDGKNVVIELNRLSIGIDSVESPGN